MRLRFKLDDPQLIYEALTVAGDAAREAAVDGDVGPWDDVELRRDNVIEVSGPDEFTDLVAERLIQADIGFEVE